jgi:type IV pilus assembly protein PilM
MRAASLMVADLGASHVAVGRLAGGSNGRLALRRFGLESFDSDPARGTDWTLRAAQALRTIVERERWSGPVTLGVSGHLALTKFIKTPAVTKSKRDKILQFEAAQNIPHPLAEVVWDHVLVSEDEVELELVLTAAKTEAMAALSSAVEAAGVSVVRIVPAGLALRDAFRFNYPEVTASVLLVDGGARSSTLLFIEGERFSLRTVASAGNAVTEAIAEELKLEFAAAEALKCDVSSRRSSLPEAAPSREAVRRAGEQFAGRLWLEIKRTTANLQRQATLAPPTAIYLTGGTALLTGLAAELAEKSKLPVESYDPFRRVIRLPGAEAAGDVEKAPRLAGLAGLAAPGVAQRTGSSVNLLPPERVAALTWRHFRPRLLGAALLLVLALLPPIWHYRSLAAATRVRMAELERELAPQRARQRRNTILLEQFDTAKRGLDDLRVQMTAKSAWREFMGDLQVRLVEVGDSWLDRIAVVSATGNADSGPPPARRLALSGRMLDRVQVGAASGVDFNRRMHRLLGTLTASPFVAAIENERYDISQPGILRFEFTLVIKPERPL